VSAVRHIGRFAAGMTVITITTLLLTQLDRIVLSRLASLEQFGYYVVAGLLSSALTAMARQTFMSVFPRFSALVATGNTLALERTYRHAWQFLSALIVPAAVVIAVFPVSLLLLWTHNATVAAAAGPIASYLVIGTAVNGLMGVPYALQIARGWTSLSIKLNLALTLIAVPAIVLAVQHRGAIGASMVWPALMAIYMAVALPITHRALLPDLGIRWFLQDLAVPVGGAVLAALACRLLLPATAVTWWLIPELSVAWLVASIAMVLPSAFLRRELARGIARALAYARGQPVMDGE
jgi:O-antigen/teichoic acid export membrane protein